MGDGIKITYNQLKVGLAILVLGLLILIYGGQTSSYNSSSNSPEIESMQRFNVGEIKENIPDVILRVSEFEKSYLNGSLTSSYAFNEMIPGPVIRANVGDVINVKVINDLNEDTTVHWHGLQVRNSEDGVPGVTQDAIAPGESFTYELDIKNSGIYWYHPHVSTHEQVEKGLYGAIIIEDNLEETIAYDEDYILMLDDISLDSNNQITSPWTGHMVLAHGRQGQNLLINGAVQPNFDVKQNSLVRLRIVNTANARTFNFAVKGARMIVVGEDIGLVRNPYTTQYVTIAPGERYDVLVKLGDAKEYELVSYNSRGYNVMGILKAGDNLGSGGTKGYEDLLFTEINSDILDFSYLANQDPNYTLQLEGIRGGDMGLEWTINGKTFPGDHENMDLVEGEVYKVRYVNKQGQVHPMHMHGQKFVILTRNGVLQDQNVWKDTVFVKGNEVVEIAFVAEGKGVWVNHCHILEHAELGMLSTVTIE